MKATKVMAGLAAGAARVAITLVLINAVENVAENIRGEGQVKYIINSIEQYQFMNDVELTQDEIEEKINQMKFDNKGDLITNQSRIIAIQKYREINNGK